MLCVEVYGGQPGSICVLRWDATILPIVQVGHDNFDELIRCAGIIVVLQIDFVWVH